MQRMPTSTHARTSLGVAPLLRPGVTRYTPVPLPAASSFTRPAAQMLYGPFEAAARASTGPSLPSVFQALAQTQPWAWAQRGDSIPQLGGGRASCERGLLAQVP